LRGQEGAAAKVEEVPWLAEVQRPPKTLPEDAPKLTPIAARSLAEWNEQRRELRRWWMEFLRPFDVPPAPPPELTILETDAVDGVVRHLVRYEVEPGIATEAYLIRPAKTTGRLPAVAVFHSTVNHSIRQPAGVEGAAEKAFGLKLAQRGCITLSPRSFLWPDNHRIAAQEETRRFHQRHPRSKGMWRMLHDALLAVDILASLPEVDPTRIGAVGHSLGAKEVLYLAAFDERVKVTVSSEGGIGTRFSNWNAAWYLGDEIESPEFTHEQHELLALAAPRPFVLLGGDSADGDKSWPFIEAALPVYRLYGEPARLGLFNHKQGGSRGVWECGSVGVWECGSVGVGE
jgi:dienelactone hydrolase